MCQHPRLCAVLVVHPIYFNNEVEQNTFGPIFRYLSIPWLKPYLKPFVYLSSMNLVKPKLEPQKIQKKHISEITGLTGNVFVPKNDVDLGFKRTPPYEDIKFHSVDS